MSAANRKRLGANIPYGHEKGVVLMGGNLYHESGHRYNDFKEGFRIATTLSFVSV